MSIDTSANSTSARPGLAPEPAGVETQPQSRWLRGKVPGEAGIWIFILGDMTLYGVLFASFMSARSKDPALFDRSATTLHTTFGAINTFLLLTSSLAVALAVRAVRERIMTNRAPMLIGVAWVCGFGFVLNKYLEYSALIRAGHQPGKNVFYEYYYVLTGIHLTHLMAGMVVLVVIRRISRKKDLQAKDVRAIETGASFWHVVDLLWMVLFPLLYLVS
jgi:nitric oxide reductase NorE protein